MAREFEIYDGARVSAPEVRLQAPEGVPASPLHGQELDAAIGAGLEVVHQYAKLKDFGTQQELRRKRAASEAAMDEEWKKKSALAWGSEGSFFHEDGSLNEDELSNFVTRWQEEDVKNRASSKFWTREAAVKEDETSANVQQGVAIEGMKRALEAEQANRKQLFEDNYQLAVAKDDWKTACAVVDEAVAGGQITRPRGEYLKLRAGKAALHSRARSGGRVRVGGREYGGLAAALRAQQARDGYKTKGELGSRQAEPAVEWKDMQGDFTLGGMPEEVSLKGTVGTETEVATPGVVKDYTLDAGGMREAAAERGVGDEWLRMGDFSGVLGSMSQSEVDEVSSLWVNDGAIVKDERPDGTVTFAAGSVTAPEAVERVAAVATEQGAINPEAARAMVARMSMDAVTQDGDATAEQICKMFDESGVYESLGNGDAEVGKVRTMQVVHEMVKRGKQGSLVLNNKNVAAAVDAVVNEAGFGEGSEWKRMEGLEPGVGEKDAYKKPKDEAGRQRWHALFNVYKQYRDRFNPQHPAGEATREEFAGVAQKFYKWYMGGSHVYKEAKAAEVNAARDWYAAKVYEGLLGNVSVGEDGKAGYGSYASDVAVMRDVLKQTPPRNLGAEERLKMLESKERDAEARSEKFRRRAAEDYERLRVMKQEHKEGSEKAQKAKDKAEADERKEQERAEVRRRNVARALPRRAEWGWDGEDDADGEMPACTLPEAEYKRLVEELGYDGTQVVYVQVQGAKIQVTGANKQGRMLLNAAAVAKVQKKPNAKKGERWKYEGSLGYSYYFKNVSANN